MGDIHAETDGIAPTYPADMPFWCNFELLRTRCSILLEKVPIYSIYW